MADNVISAPRVERDLHASGVERVSTGAGRKISTMVLTFPDRASWSRVSF